MENNTGSVLEDVYGYGNEVVRINQGVLAFLFNIFLKWSYKILFKI